MRLQVADKVDSNDRDGSLVRQNAYNVGMVVIKDGKVRYRINDDRSRSRWIEFSTDEHHRIEIVPETDEQ